MKPLISIVIPTYNAVKYLEETIQSVQKQTITNWELIIIDDCSKDNTCQIIEQYIEQDNRIQLVICEENFGGPAKPRNIGMRKAKGQYIAFLDADDIWIADKLEKQLLAFQKYPNMLAISTNQKTFPNGKNNDLLLFNNKWMTFKEYITKLKGIVQSSVLMKREVIDKIGFFDEDKRLIATEDYDYWLRLLHYQNQSILILKEVLVHYRLHPNNISKASNDKQLSYHERLLVVYQKYEKEFPQYAKNLQKNLVRLKNQQYLKSAYYNNQISTGELFDNQKITFIDKISILLKRRLQIVLSNLLK